MDWLPVAFYAVMAVYYREHHLGRVGRISQSGLAMSEHKSDATEQSSDGSGKCH